VKAFVTGSSGFLGRHLVRRLRAENVWVRTLVRYSTTKAVVADDVLEGDLRDPALLERAVQGVDLVFHAGARVATSGSWDEFEATNVAATDNLIRAAMAAKVKRVVHVSSLSVYAVPYDGATITEDSPYEAGAAERGLYARSKLAADELACRAMASGAPVTVVRPGLLFGPGRRPPLARRSIAAGPLRFILARPSYRLPLAFVENVADALWLAARTPAAQGRAYSIVDVHAQQGDYLRLVREITGQRMFPIFVPITAVMLAVNGAEAAAKKLKRRSPISTHQVQRTVWSAQFDVRRAEAELGWTPRVSLPEALRRSFGISATPALEQVTTAARSAA
jgi:nucleoside-diphosphate-sugar epimerase